MENKNTQNTFGFPAEFTGAADAIETLASAVCRNVLCNTSHGLTQEQFDAIMVAQNKAIITLKVLRSLSK